MIGRKIKEKFCSGITLTNNEIKDIMKVIKSLENRRSLIKGTTRKFTSKEGGFLNFLRLLMAGDLPLMKSALIPLVKSVLIPLGLSAGIWAADAAIQKRIYGSVLPLDLPLRETTLLISNEETESIMKIIKSHEQSGLLIKEISKTFRNKTKEQKGGFLRILPGILAASILGNALTGKRVLRAGEGVINACEKCSFHLILFWNTNYYQNLMMLIQEIFHEKQRMGHL